MTEVPRSRRERLRAQTAAEIRAIARRLLEEGGPDAVSLRAIAREMGMTPGALYGYYATRDELVTILIGDVYASLMDAIEAARDAHPPSDAAGRVLAWAEAFRTWSVANPQGFRLVYGDPVLGYQPPPGGPAPDAEHRACRGLIGLVATAWPLLPAHDEAADHGWDDFAPRLVAEVREAFPDLPPSAVGLALRVWGRMHGLVALEVYGHLRAQVRDPAKLYRSEMRDLVASLGLAPWPATP